MLCEMTFSANALYLWQWISASPCNITHPQGRHYSYTLIYLVWASECLPGVVACDTSPIRGIWTDQISLYFNPCLSLGCGFIILLKHSLHLPHCQLSQLCSFWKDWSWKGVGKERKRNKVACGGGDAGLNKCCWNHFHRCKANTNGSVNEIAETCFLNCHVNIWVYDLLIMWCLLVPFLWVEMSYSAKHGKLKS